MAPTDRRLGTENVHRFQRTPDFVKARAMQLYAEYGLEETSVRMGVNKTTINRWRKELGVPSKKMAPVTIEDVEQALKEQTMYRLDVSNLLIQKARFVLQKIDNGVKGEEIYNLARSAAVLLDRYRLEQGEATSRKETQFTEQDPISEKERRLLLRDLSAELAERERRKAEGAATGTSGTVPEGSEASAVRRLSSSTG